MLYNGDCNPTYDWVTGGSHIALKQPEMITISPRYDTGHKFSRVISEWIYPRVAKQQ